MAFRRKSARPVSLLVVGLGNPGPEYARTRHNVGFMAIDRLADRLSVRLDHREKKALVSEAAHPADGSTSILLAKPQTFMNLSGRSVVALLHKHGLEPSDLWLVYDELDLSFGKLRIRLKGSPGGHNGVGSVVDELGSRDFPRFRVGIGRPNDPDPVDYLLSAFTPEETDRLPALLDLTVEAITSALTDGMEIAMNQYNGKSV